MCMAGCVVAAVLAVGAGTAPLGAQRLARPVITHLPGGITEVMNPGPTAWADTNGWKLVLETTVEPPAGSPGELDRPSGIAFTSAGGIVEWETQPPVVRLYDSSGRFVRQLGRSGEGPGEYRRPIVAVHHDTVMIHDPTLRRGTVMTLDGKPTASFQTACCDMFPLVIDSLGRFGIHVGVRVEGQIWPRAEWHFLDRNGTASDVIAVPTAAGRSGSWLVTTQYGQGTFTIPLAGRSSSLLLPSDEVVSGVTDRETFVVSRTGRDTVRIFGRTGVAPAPAPRGLRDSLFHAMVDRNASLKAVASERDIPNVLPLWNELATDGAGNFWVQTGGHGTPYRFDVFRPDGRYLGAVAAPFGGYLSNTTWSADRVAAIETDADGLPVIRIYRIEKHGIQ